ncbi:hypothetical protein C8Q75DRAFT_789147 [Abortiporus biennis]|nr:hypothetical protein C8Q75DRAFT_789147 [Abortiporus biennis]
MEPEKYSDKEREPARSMKRLIDSCSFPGCDNFYRPDFKAKLKCSQCKSMPYCNKACQKAHWPTHKEFCSTWAETASINSGITVAKAKVKMAKLMWLVRGMPDYCEEMWDQVNHWRSRGAEGKGGFIEFYFENFQQLFDAVETIENMPIFAYAPFVGMPGSPSCGSIRHSGGGPQDLPKPLKLPLRRYLNSQKERFLKTVHERVAFTQNDERPNLQMALKLAERNKDMFVLSVSVQLKGTYCTHMHDFIYRHLSYEPPLPPPASSSYQWQKSPRAARHVGGRRV